MPRLRWPAAVFVAWLAAGAGAQPAEGGGVAFSGHYRNAVLASRTTLGGVERYRLDANRLRLEWQGQLEPGARIEFQYDNEVLLGSYLGTRQFALERDLPRRTYLDLEGDYARAGEALGRHRIRRATLTLSAGATDLRLGRQRVAWGTGRIFSPLDLLNPVHPTALEPGEREGVDALVVEHKRSAVSRASFVWAPARAARDHALVQWHANAAGVDYSVTGGQVREGRLVGVDLAGQVGGAGLRAEWTATRSPAGATVQRVLLGWDYAFANSLALTVELHHDGAGSRDPARYDFAGLLAGRRQAVGRRYAGLHARYEITPLLRWDNWLAHNLVDRSWYYSPRLTWSVRENFDLVLGAQLHAGGAATEFGRRANLRFAWAQWFF